MNSSQSADEKSLAPVNRGRSNGNNIRNNHASDRDLRMSKLVHIGKSSTWMESVVTPYSAIAFALVMIGGSLGTYQLRDKWSDVCFFAVAWTALAGVYRTLSWISSTRAANIAKSKTMDAMVYFHLSEDEIYDSGEFNDAVIQRKCDFFRKNNRSMFGHNQALLDRANRDLERNLKMVTQLLADVRPFQESKRSEQRQQ